MNTYDLELAFYEHLIALTYNNLETVRPDEIMDPESVSQVTAWRRGVLLPPNSEPAGFGHGVYTRIFGTYQIDLWVPRKNYNALGGSEGALKQIKLMSDAHLTHFFPANGRGQTLTKNTTSAHIERRPEQRFFGREGAFLREVIEVEFYADVPPSV